MNTYPFTTVQIREIVEAPKSLRHPEFLYRGKDFAFDRYGDRGRRIELWLDVSNPASVLDLKLHIRGSVVDDPETFEAALLLAGRRVRGIGWHATGKKRFYKQAIPKGWHQNILDPNAAVGSDRDNRHDPLISFEPTDLADFLMKAADLWKISLPIERSLL